ncbi:MAG: DUF1924 domain-containing protein [Rhizobiales bacterium]|nr:DUF1924 domain-containing protein [Hyphomicrobiales bacterium]
MTLSSAARAAALALALAATAAAAATLSPGRQAVVAALGAGDAAAGKAFFFARHTGGKADTPACTACHTTDLTKAGQTKAGKAIDPMAASRAPDRFSDLATVEKWFRRNCTDVLGRECTKSEKANVIAYLLSI